MKKTKSANDKSQLSSPQAARPLNRLTRSRPTENVSQGSAGRKASTNRKPDSLNLTPTRSSTRKCRPAAKVTVIEDTSDSDWSPPPSIISSSPMKSSILEKRALRRKGSIERDHSDGLVIDLTVPQTPKSPRKRPKLDSRLPFNLDSFINLCSDEEMNPSPQKKRKVSIPANDVIFISSDDEVEPPQRQFLQRTPPSLEHAAEAQYSKEGRVAGYSAAITDPVASDTSHEMDNSPNVSTPRPTPPPVSPLENDSPESMIVDLTASQDMTRIEKIPTPKISRKLLNDLYQKSLQNPPVTTTEVGCSTSFCNTPGPELKQRIHKVVHNQAKRALLTSLIFARPMRSLGTASRPKANINPQRPESSKAVVLVESSVEETNSLNQGDIVPINFQSIVLNTLTSSALSSSSFTDTSRSADTVAMNAVTPDNFLDIYDDVRILSASPVMEVDETEVEPVFSEDIDDSLKEPVPSTCTDESSARDVPSMEVVEECAMHDTSIFHEGQADNHFAEASFTESEPMQNSEKPSECVLRIGTSLEQVGDIPIPSCPTTFVDILHEGSSYSDAQADEPLTLHPTLRDTHLPSRGPSHTMDNNISADDTLSNPLPREASPNLQTYINSSIFEVEHLPNLTFQNLFASNRFVDDVSDLAISLPCYPERLHY